MAGMKPQNLIIMNQWALGDTVCLSALVRDIHRAYPGRYRILMNGNYKNVFWRNNPNCEVLTTGYDGATVFSPNYVQGIREAGRGVKRHFLAWFHEEFKRKFNLEVPVTEPKGDIHLTEMEKANRLVPHRYWLVVAGGKLDMPAKIWYTDRFQRVVDTLAHYGVYCIQAGNDARKHYHPTLLNCGTAVGKTRDERDLFSLIYHAEGIICGITSFMHLAAVFDKPCVVIAGGREEWWWEAYSNHGQFGPTCSQVAVEHAYLHTIGLYDCQSTNNGTKGCWKDRVVPLEQADLTHPNRKNKICERPLRNGIQPMASCMAEITVDHVVEAVMRYYELGLIPPIDKPAGKYRLPVMNVDPAKPGTDQTVALAVQDDKPVWPPAFTREFTLPAPISPINKELEILDHPYIGGKFTVFVLCYGDHLDLAQRCLGSIIANSPASRLDLRVALNQPSERVTNYVFGLGDAVRKIYVDDGDRRKYPAMREMFWDKDCPVTTKYLLWFDDDSWVADPKWLALLGHEIAANHPHGSRLYGCRYTFDLAPFVRPGHNPKTWFEKADWWRGKPFYTRGGTATAPNGSTIVFATGGFWALCTKAMREGNIPDPRLVHTGGDITIGAVITQLGYKVKDFCRGKRPVCWSDAKPRGISVNGPAKRFPWSPPE